MHLKKLISFYSILIGIAVIGMWIVILVTQPVAEGVIELSFHLYSEFAMAVVLLVSGVMMLYSKKFARMTNMGGLGMLVYSTINAAGYYGEKGDQDMMVMFMVLAVLSIGAICGHYYGRRPIPST
jgi:hypothetical protein